MALLLNEEIKFPHWDGDPQCEPYGTYKVLADALKYGRSLDAAMRAADDEELLIDNDDVFTRKLILKAVDLRRADVVRFMVERGADLNHVWEVLRALMNRCCTPPCGVGGTRTRPSC